MAAPRGSVALALAWAARGLRVFPLVPLTKRPRDKQFYSSASSDPEVVKALFADGNWNIGVSTCNMLVVDVDMKNGKNGLKAFFELDMPLNTLVVETPTGGFHYYYRSPNVANTAGKLGEGIDTRSHHGYVIAPGSIIPEGAYTLSNDAPLAHAPPHILALLSEPRERKREGFTVSDDDEIALKVSEAYLQTADGAVEGSNGDQHTFNVACKLRDLGCAELTAYCLMLDLWNERCDPPWSPEELETKVANAYLYATSSAGHLHPLAQFSGVDIEPPEEKGRKWVRHGAVWEKDSQWLFYHMLPATGVAILTGLPGSGKTFMATHIAEKLATGDPWFGENPDERGGTVILAAEGQGSLGPRLSVLGEGKGRLPISGTPVGALSDRSAWETLRSDLHAECDRMLKSFDVPVALVVLDTLSASGLVGDENNNSECAKAMKKLEELAREFDVLVMVLHHPPKNGEGVRGGSALLASADYVLEIEVEKGKKVRTLSLTKARDSEAPRKLGGFTLVTKVTGQDSRDRNITTCYVETSQSKAFTGAQPPRWENFIQAKDWARINTSTPLKDPVSDDAVYLAFRSKYEKEAGAATSFAYRACRSYAIDQGMIEMIEDLENPGGDCTIMDLKVEL